MESKIKSNEKPKTKKQIEAEYPFVKPENCPGAVMDWVIKREEKREEDRQKRDKELVDMIGRKIDTMFEKHFKQYVTMIHTNRILSILTLTGLGLLSLFFIYHLSH
jgi:hypothetical protein